MEQLSAGFKRLALALIALSLIGSVLGFFPSIFWFQEINANLGPYYLALHLLSLPLIFACSKESQTKLWRFCLWGLIAMIARYCFILYPFYATPLKGKSSPHFKLLYANVLRPNTRYEDLARQIKQQAPDVIALTEYDQVWEEALKLGEYYPYHAGNSAAGHFSIALYSKFPFSMQPLLSLGDPLPPVIALELELKEQRSKIYILLLHTRPPVSNDSINQNYLIFRRAATLLRQKRFDSPNLIVLGDFNATPFSRFYRKFVEWNKLNNAMHGFGLQKTWQADSWCLFFNLDHVFYRGNLRVRDFKVLPEFGSDHFPLLVEFGAREEVLEAFDKFLD